MLGMNEEKLFSEKDTFLGFVDALESVSEGRWVQKNEMLAAGLPDAPILSESISGGIEFHDKHGNVFRKKADCSSDEISSCMGSTKLVLMFPGDGNEQVYPLSNNGLISAVARAGYGSSSVLCNTSGRKGVSEMPSEVKAMILNEAFPLYSGDDKDPDNVTQNKVYVYRCDGFVDFVGSNNYSPTAASSAIKTVEETANAIFPVEFVSGSISRSCVMASYEVLDAKLKSKIEEVFLKGGINVRGCAVSLKFCTSQIGMSGMNLYPTLQYGDTTIPLDVPMKLEHKNGVGLEELANNVKEICSMYRATPQRIQSLEDIVLSNPEDTFKNMSLSAGLPQKFFYEKAVDFASSYPSASMLDMYFAMFDALAEYKAETELRELEYIQLTERLARLFFGSYVEKIDVPGTVKVKIAA